MIPGKKKGRKRVRSSGSVWLAGGACVQPRKEKGPKKGKRATEKGKGKGSRLAIGTDEKAEKGRAQPHGSEPVIGAEIATHRNKVIRSPHALRKNGIDDARGDNQCGASGGSRREQPA